MTNLFVYGTLQAEEVLLALIGRVPQIRSASLKGYRRYGLSGLNFPGTVRSVVGDEVDGQVLFDVNSTEVSVFDAFEGDEYYKQHVIVFLEDGTPVEADVYLWHDDGRHLLSGTWDYQAWRNAHLQEYVEMCKGLDFSLHQSD
eukprot:jgi/Botrbrau1/6390/Bobra.49_1s0008.1